MSVVLVAPFWPWPGHVGVYRIDRMVRALAERGVPVVLARAGRTDGVETTPWGVVVRIADPLRFFPDVYGAVGSGADRPPRRPVILRRTAALALAPDPSVPWSLRAMSHAPLLEHARGAAWVVSSSPPESAHVAAVLLARRLGARLAVDLRDGWLDEPPRPELHYAWRAWLEGRMERAILRRASRILVTSRVWGEMLERRLPFTAQRTVVLTNACPPHSERIARTAVSPAPIAPTGRELTLLYAGRFTSSRAARTMEGLLAPLADGMRRTDVRGTVRIVGELDAAEISQADLWRARLAEVGWRLAVDAAVPREELLRRCARADGLLLCDPSPAVLPSKLFEYLPTGRPIFAATPASGALAEVVAALPQGFVAGGERERDARESVRFLEACARPDHPSALPEQFGEPAFRRRFLEALDLGAGHDTASRSQRLEA